MQRPLYLLLALALLLSGLAAGWLAITLRSRVKQDEEEDELRISTALPLMPPLTSQGKARITSVGKALGLVLIGVLIGWIGRGRAYDYSKEYAAWKAMSADYQKDYATYQQLVSAWKARHKENR